MKINRFLLIVTVLIVIMTMLPVSTALAVGEPLAPSGLTATALSGPAVRLDWTDNSADEDGFRVERAVDDAFTLDVNSMFIDPDLQTYTDDTVEAGITYYYRVFAFNGNGDSAPTDVVGILISNEPPSVLTTGAEVEDFVATLNGLLVSGGNEDAINVSFEYGTESGVYTDETAPQTITAAAPGPSLKTHLLAVMESSDTDNISDFVGNPIRIVAGIPYMDWLKAALVDYGILEADIIWVATPSSNRLAALQVGAVDAVLITEHPDEYFEDAVNDGEVILLDWSNDAVIAAIAAFPNDLVTGGLPADTYTGSLDIAGYAPKYAAAFSFELDNLPPDSTYFFRAKAADGVTVYGDEMSFDIPEIDAPEDLEAEIISETQVDLSWEDNSEGESGFRIERALDEDFEEELITEEVDEDIEEYSDTTVMAGETYYYRVIAFTGGGESEPSDTAAVTIAVAEAPSDLDATRVTDSQVDLSWTDNSNGEDGFRIISSIEEDFSNSITFTVAADETTYSDNTTYAGEIFYYKVVAFNALGDSAPSNVASVYIAEATASVPAAPGSLTAVIASATEVNLAWTDNSNSELGLQVERAADEAFTLDVVSVATGPNVVSYTDTIAAHGRYYYRITAFNAIGNSAPSNVARVDFVIPDAPVIQGAVISATQARITWLDVPYETGYSMERANNDQFTGPVVIPGPADSQSFTLNVVPDETLYFRLYAVNLVGVSPASNVISITVTTPGKPTGLTALAPAPGRVELSWTDDSTNETGFRIERATDAAFTMPVPLVTFTVPANTTSYIDTTVASGVTYYYRIVAINGLGETIPDVISILTAVDAGGGGSAGGGGGSAGGVGTFSGFIANAPLYIDLNTGELMNEVRLRNADSSVIVVLPKGTIMKDASGKPLSGISLKPAGAMPIPPAGNVIVLGYQFEPSGATFSPPISITLKYDPAKLPAGVTEDQLVAACWDGSSWDICPTTVDSAGNMVTAEISHFSHVVLLGQEALPPAVTITSPQATDSVMAGSVTVSVAVENLQLVAPGGANAAGQGHIHYYLDVTAPSTPGMPAVSAAGTYQVSNATSVVWQNITAGSHTFTVQLVNNDHTPFVPPVTASVTVAVAAAPAPTPMPTPTSTPTPAPAPAPISTPVPTPTVTPTPTTVPTVPAPAPAPTPTPSAPASAANWWLISGLIGAAFAVGLVIHFATRSKPMA